MVAALLVAGCGVLSSDDDEGTGETTTVAQGSGEEVDEGEATAAGGESEAAQVADENAAATEEQTAASEQAAASGEGPAAEAAAGVAAGAAATPTPTLTPGSETATQLPPADGEVPSAQAGLAMIPGLGSAATFPRFFSQGSPWNTRVSDDRVDSRSRRLIRLAQVRTSVVEQADGRFRTERRTIDEGLTVNARRWTVPVFTEQGGVPTLARCRQLDCGPDAVEEIVIPPEARPDPRFDGWMTVIDTGARRALDFWRARREEDGSISYHYVKAWDLDGPGFQEPGGVSARGSGLPLFAGLIRPEEIDAGRIDHALAISIPGAAKERFVQPASRTDGVGPRRSVPEGARLRLRATNPRPESLLSETFIRNRRQREVAQVIIEALKHYGAIVVDRSAAPTLYAQRNARWGSLLPPRAGRSRPSRGERAARSRCARGDSAAVTVRARREAGSRRGGREEADVRQERRRDEAGRRGGRAGVMNLLQDLCLHDFEVLELPEVLNDPGSFTEIDAFGGLQSGLSPSGAAGAGAATADEGEAPPAATTTGATTTPGATTTTPTTEAP